MPPRLSYRYSSSYDSRYPYAPRSPRRYRRGGDGCLSDIQEFFTNLLRVIGVVDLVDIVQGSQDPWALPGQYGWLPAHARAISVLCAGRPL